MAGCYQVTKLVLRVLEVIFALIAFSAAGWILDTNSTGPSDLGLVDHSRTAYMVFTGVTAFVLAGLYAISFCVPRMQAALWGIVEVVINFIWTVFWLAAAAAFAADATCEPNSFWQGDQICNAFLTAEAFAWLSWFLWIASLVFSVLDWRAGEGPASSKRYPTGPQSSVQM